MIKALKILAFLDTEIVAELLRSRLEAHGVQVNDAATVTLRLCLDESLPENTCMMQSDPGGWTLSAPSLVTLCNGMGRFLHESRYTEEGMEPHVWNGLFTFDKPLRAIYFATHFYNFYHCAPLDEVQVYLEDLALWGFNTLAFWNDLHHFRSFDDPEAVDFRARLSSFAVMARRLGMKLFYLVVSNESYSESPEELRAVKQGGVRGGWYDSQICPSRPGGLDYLKAQFERLCRDYIAELQPDYITIWPYDQGGCGCKECAPWGGNAYLKLYEAYRQIAETYMPKAQWVVSFWLCNETEWHCCQEKLKANPNYCEYLMEEKPLFKERPADGVSLIGFPEISMNHNPWGGFGIAPQPTVYQKQWDARKHELAGGYPYSEGIFEDLHKVIFAQFYCLDRPAWESVRLYAAYEFGDGVADRVVELVRLLEQNHSMPRKAEWFIDDSIDKMDWLLSRVTPLDCLPVAQAAFDLAKSIDEVLPPAVQTSWRWRIIMLRAELDREFAANGGLPTLACDKAFAELIDIYHAERSDEWVRPPISNRGR